MKNEKCKVLAAALIAAMVALALMGCWFCWHCPSKIYPPEAHGLFWRQLAWNGVGLAVFAAVWLSGWKRLLRAAPWLMAAWLGAIVIAQFSRPINGAHKWLCVGFVRVNVMTCFMPVLALFVAWLHEKKWIRPWMEWTAVSVAALLSVGYVLNDGGRMERLMAFLNHGDWPQDRLYMARQLLAAFDVSNWFGDADRSLGFLPCAETDGMLSASALMFGKWFPAAIVMLFAVVGVNLTLFWKCAVDVPMRRFALLFGLWLLTPMAYCLLHSLAFLPVAGMSPAVAGYGGTAVVMAWLGIGAIAAILRGGALEDGPGNRVSTNWPIMYAWGALACMAVFLVAFAPKRVFLKPGGDRKFAEPRPSDMEFGDFGLMAKRGRILAADGTPIAYTVRAWRFYIDPCATDKSVYGEECLREISDGLGVAIESLLKSYVRIDDDESYSRLCDAAIALGVPGTVLEEERRRGKEEYRRQRRYIFLAEVDDGSSASSFFDRRRSWLTRRAGIIREPIQKRVYPLGAAAAAVVGFMHDDPSASRPRGAGGLEWSCDRALAGVNGVYDGSLPLKERSEKATPKPGSDVWTTLVPGIQKAVAEVLLSECAMNGAESAFAIVMKVSSGEIAAMASWPTFDPSMHRSIDAWEPSMAVNRAACSCFEPGGVVAPLVNAIAMDETVLTNELLHAGLQRFGFGKGTGTAGIAGEEAGFFASSAARWDSASEASAAMGYGFAVTGLQVVQAYAALANRGMKVAPRLLAGECARGVGCERAVSSDVADAVVEALKDGVVLGTAKMAREGGYSLSDVVVSCLMLYPSDKPESVVLVSFARPCSAVGGEESARRAAARVSGTLSCGF